MAGVRATRPIPGAPLSTRPKPWLIAAPGPLLRRTHEPEIIVLPRLFLRSPVMSRLGLLTAALVLGALAFPDRPERAWAQAQAPAQQPAADATVQVPGFWD